MAGIEIRQVLKTFLLFRAYLNSGCFQGIFSITFGLWNGHSVRVFSGWIGNCERNGRATLILGASLCLALIFCFGYATIRFSLNGDNIVPFERREASLRMKEFLPNKTSIPDKNITSRKELNTFWCLSALNPVYTNTFLGRKYSRTYEYIFVAIKQYPQSECAGNISKYERVAVKRSCQVLRWQ